MIVSLIGWSVSLGAMIIGDKIFPVVAAVRTTVTRFLLQARRLCKTSLEPLFVNN